MPPFRPLPLHPLSRRTRLARLRPGALMAAALAIAAVLAAGPAGAQQWVGQVRGVGSQPVPAGSPVSVMPGSADDTDMRLADDVAAALTAAGYRVVDATTDSGVLMLWFDTEMSAATVGNDPGAANMTEVGDPLVDDETLGYGGVVGVDDRDVVDPVDQVSVPFGPGGRRGGGQPYSLTFVVGPSGAPPLWQGAMTTRLGAGDDPYEVARAMLPALTGAIGRTVVAEQSFP